MPFVQAKCPNCGGFLAVDNEKEAAVCQFCQTPFIVEKAINNYNININNHITVEQANVRIEGAPSKENLLKRAQNFERSGDIVTALKYYEKVLDLDVYNNHAINGIRRINQGVFFSDDASHIISSGKLCLVKDYIVYKRKSGKTIVIALKDCLGAKSSFKNLTIIKKEMANKSSIVHATEVFGILAKRKGAAKEWVQVINNAIKGVYPSQI